ncbi:hypothetical protein EJB05_28955, partial [Eragrostis curvula]
MPPPTARPQFSQQPQLPQVEALRRRSDTAATPCAMMGMADAIVDLVSSGATLRENNLKEIEGGVV